MAISEFLYREITARYSARARERGRTAKERIRPLYFCGAPSRYEWCSERNGTMLHHIQRGLGVALGEFRHVLGDATIERNRASVSALPDIGECAPPPFRATSVGAPLSLILAWPGAAMVRFHFLLGLFFFFYAPRG